MNLYDADDELQDGPLTEPDSLRDLIIAQGMEETGIFVLLFTSDTAAENPMSAADSDSDSDSDSTAAAAGEATAAAAETVSGMAAELELDTAALTLFSDDAYLLQAALGETFVPEPAEKALRGNV